MNKLTLQEILAFRRGSTIDWARIPEEIVAILLQESDVPWIYKKKFNGVGLQRYLAGLHAWRGTWLEDSKDLKKHLGPDVALRPETIENTKGEQMKNEPTVELSVMSWIQAAQAHEEGHLLDVLINIDVEAGDWRPVKVYPDGTIKVRQGHLYRKRPRAFKEGLYWYHGSGVDLVIKYDKGHWCSASSSVRTPLQWKVIESLVGEQLK